MGILGNEEHSVEKVDKAKVSAAGSKLQHLITIYLLKYTAQQRLMKWDPAKSHSFVLKSSRCFEKVPVSTFPQKLQCFYIISSISHHMWTCIPLILFIYLFMQLWTPHQILRLPYLYLLLLIEHLHLFPQVFSYVIMSPGISACKRITVANTCVRRHKTES